MTLRIPFGMDRLPRNLPPDDPRLPGVEVGAIPLRFNTQPLPPEAMEATPLDHASRTTAMQQYLRSLCGGYAAARVRFVDAYIEALQMHLDQHCDELTQGLAGYDGLYAPEDWLWSALRPLPRAWVRTGSRTTGVDVAFWDGVRMIAIDLNGAAPDEDITIVRLPPDALTGSPGNLLDLLPETFRHFWRGETVPRSPFRRALPRGVLAELD